MRAIKGETVISVVEENEPEHQNDPWIGDLVYEVYMPLYNSSGVLLGVGEIYSSVELLVARVDTMIGEIDRIRTMVLTFGILLLATLIFYAQRRLNRQENEILHSLRSQEALTRRNAELLAESEELRQALSDDNERFLTHIGAELHDGPIQLLSLSSLYRSQVPVAPEHAETEEKARELASEGGLSLGLIGMAKRARSIGGHLSVEQTAGNFIVTLTLPRLARSAPGLMLRTTDMPQAAQ